MLLHSFLLSKQRMCTVIEDIRSPYSIRLLHQNKIMRHRLARRERSMKYSTIIARGDGQAYRICHSPGTLHTSRSMLCIRGYTYEATDSVESNRKLWRIIRAMFRSRISCFIYGPSPKTKIRSMRQWGHDFGRGLGVRKCQHTSSIVRPGSEGTSRIAIAARAQICRSIHAQLLRLVNVWSRLHVGPYV